MAGDRIDILGKSHCPVSNTGDTSANKAIPVLDILTGLLGGPTGSIASAAHGGVTAGQLNGIAGITSGLADFLGDQTTDAASAPTVPKAYINYIFFDEQFRVSGSGFSRVGGTTVKSHTDLMDKIAPKSGYVYIYISNESPVNVYFDNLQVIHTRGPILEETHYYPFGLTMAGISSKALGGIAENKYRFNGIEHNNDFDLNMYDAFYRNLDPQIGRWWQIDPKPNDSESLYAAMGNNPILYSDFLGDTSILSQAANAFWGGVDWVNRNLNPLVDLYHLTTGKDFITGEDVSRGSAGTGLAMSLIPGGKVEGAALKTFEKTVVKEGAEVVEKDIVSKGVASLDNNALVAATREGQKEAVVKAIGDNTPIVSISAAKEYLAWGNKSDLKAFMTEIGATISKNGAGNAQISQLQNTAKSLGRSLKSIDASIAGGAINNNATLITNDRKLSNFLKAINQPVKNY